MFNLLKKSLIFFKGSLPSQLILGSFFTLFPNAKIRYLTSVPFCLPE